MSLLPFGYSRAEVAVILPAIVKSFRSNFQLLCGRYPANFLKILIQKIAPGSVLALAWGWFHFRNYWLWIKAIFLA